MSSSEPSDTMRERVGGSGVRLYLLLRMNRWLLAGTILAISYVVLVAASHADLTPLRRIVEQQNGIAFLFSSFIGAIITGTSIVVTLNQLVLSQELGAIGDQRERMSEAMDFRREVEEQIKEGASPPEPAAYLYDMVDGVQDRAERLRDTTQESRDEELREKINEYVDSLNENAEAVKEGLEDAQFGTFEVIWNALNFNYSWKIYSARQIRSKHSESLSEEANEAIDDVIETLKFFGPAREHFKTLYFQWELIDLSRALLYSAVPALVMMGAMIMYVDGNTFVGATLGVDNLVWVASAGFVVGMTPFIIFTVYVLRIATVAKRTLAMGPFILRETNRDEELEGGD